MKLSKLRFDGMVKLSYCHGFVFMVSELELQLGLASSSLPSVNHES